MGVITLVYTLSHCIIHGHYMKGASNEPVHIIHYDPAKHGEQLTNKARHIHIYAIYLCQLDCGDFYLSVLAIAIIPL